MRAVRQLVFLVPFGREPLAMGVLRNHPIALRGERATGRRCEPTRLTICFRFSRDLADYSRVRTLNVVASRHAHVDGVRQIKRGH